VWVIGVVLLWVEFVGGLFVVLWCLGFNEYFLLVVWGVVVGVFLVVWVGDCGCGVWGEDVWVVYVWFVLFGGFVMVCIVELAFGLYGVLGFFFGFGVGFVSYGVERFFGEVWFSCVVVCLVGWVVGRWWVWVVGVVWGFGGGVLVLGCFGVLGSGLLPGVWFGC
jgi:hypothetical protein